MQIAAVADSHVPTRAQSVPDEVVQACEDADIVVHAGDFDSQEAYETFDSAADELVAVYGNMDERALDLSDVDSFTADGWSFVVTHGTGSPDGYKDRLAQTARDEEVDADVVVGGHTHGTLDEVHDGLRLLNPGTCTGASPSQRATYMVVETGDELSVEVFEV